MAQKNVTDSYWNPFAHELQKILNKYGMGLGHLDDRLGIHREKVRRLIQSLQTPPGLPILNPEDTQVIIDELQLDSEDVLRLRASIIATSIQRVLSDRIHQDEARLAAQQILPTIVQALIDHADETGLGNVRGSEIDPIDGELDAALDTVLSAIDRASESLQLSYHINSYTECVKKVRQARNYYEDALADLKGLNKALRKQRVWQYYYDEVQKGLTQAKSRLEELGE